MKAAARMWPAPGHEQLIRAALGDDAEALARWSARVDIEALDPSSQRLLPLLAGRPGLEPAVAEQIRRTQRFAWVQTQGRMLNARDALRAITADGIDVLLIKGVAVVQAAGLNPRDRLMDDIDLAVRPEDAPRAAEILLEHGFRMPYRTALDGFRGNPGTHFETAVGGHLDLHAHFLARALSSRVDAPVWAAATPAELHGVPCLLPRREDLVVQAIVHGASPIEPRPVRWISDTVALVRAPGFDWERVATLARHAGVELIVGGGLQVVAALTTAEVPDTGLLRRPHVVQRLAMPRRRRRLRAHQLLADEYLMWRGRSERPSVGGFLAETFGLRSRGTPARPVARLVRGERREIGTSPEHLTAGFWVAERFGAWSRDRLAVVDLPLAEPASGPLLLRLELAAPLTPICPVRTVVAIVGRRPVGAWRLRGTDFGRHERCVRLTVAPGTRHLRLRLLAGAAGSPQLIGLVSDPRPAGVGLCAVTVE